jgi:hypothetical protein
MSTGCSFAASDSESPEFCHSNTPPTNASSTAAAMPSILGFFEFMSPSVRASAGAIPVRGRSASRKVEFLSASPDHS